MWKLLFASELEFQVYLARNSSDWRFGSRGGNDERPSLFRK